MTVWSAQHSTYNMRYAWRVICALILSVVVITTLFALSDIAKAAPGTISFSARLRNATGGVVADGHYNVEFRLYSQGSGGTPVWSETYHDANGATPGQDARLRVANGYLGAQLGSQTAFPASINWSGNLWLTMNIGGTEQIANPVNIQWDGEMSPRIQLSAVPYAMSAGSLGGRTADQLVQLGQGVQTDASDNSSVFINKTGSGNLMQLQRNGNDEFTIAGNGDLTLGSGGDKTISIATSAPDTAGRELAIRAGSGGSGGGSDGGNLVLQAGDAGGANGGGGNVIISGGSANGEGPPGLVIIDTPTFSTTTNDDACYTEGGLVDSSCSITQSSVDSSAAVIVGFSAIEQTAHLPEPTNKTAGRIIYVIAADDSEDFSLSYSETDPEKKITLQKNTAATMIWSGSSWVTVSGSASTPPNLQDVYDNSDGELVLNGDSETGGLVIRSGNTNSTDEKILEVQNSSSGSILSINSQVTSGSELATDGAVVDAENFSSNWQAVGEATVTQRTDEGHSDESSAQLVATSSADGMRNNLQAALEPATTYRVSFYAKAVSSQLDNLSVFYDTIEENLLECTNYSTQSVGTDQWKLVSCEITTTTAQATNSSIVIRDGASESYALLVDDLSVTKKPVSSQNVKVGNDREGEDATLFTLDQSSAPPAEANNEALLGSMYYDTTIGKVQCLEADGWGDCSSSPDTFVTISPQYAGAVMNGADIGRISSDICSGSLGINDGSDSQPEVCGQDETYNFYGWTSEESTSQTRSIYVTYQLPDNFSGFVPGSTSIMGRTDGTASVTYQAYRDNGASLTPCGMPVNTATGEMTSWNRGMADGSSDPAICDFEAGQSIYFRIDLVASNNHNAYVSNIDFTFNNK